MSSAIFALIVNTTVALLFAASFAVMASTNVSQRRLLWFSLAYCVGAVTPLSELLVRLSPTPTPFVALSYASFVAAFYITVVALCRLYRMAIPWILLGTLFFLSIAVRALIWGGTRNEILYELTYQTPFAVAVAMCALTIWRALPRGQMDRILLLLFGVSSAHFVVKAFLAVHFGSGMRATDYVSSVYALMSQSATGILLTSIGLTLLLICVRKIVSEANSAADHDALSGLLNRRGFQKAADQFLAKAQQEGRRVAVSLFDLDHFKRINDDNGHDIGDWFISAFAEILRICGSSDCVISRLGGEEFVVLESIEISQTGREFGEMVRQHLVHLKNDQIPELRVTVSVGVASDVPGARLTDLLKRADRALYAAKSAGRNCVFLERPVLVSPTNIQSPA